MRRQDGSDAWPPLLLDAENGGGLLAVAGTSALVVLRESPASLAGRSSLGLLRLESGLLAWGLTPFRRPVPLRLLVRHLRSGPAGEVFAFATDPDGALRVLRLVPETGAPLWVSEPFPGLTPVRTLVDGRGDLLLVGWDAGRSVILKLFGSTGTRTWGPGGVSPGPGTSSAEAANLDPSGDLVMAAVTRSPTTFRDEVKAVKVSGQTGAVVWSTPPIGEVGDARFAAVAVDPAGDVLIAFGSPTNDGQLLHAARVSGTTSRVLFGPVRLFEARTVWRALADAQGNLTLVTVSGSRFQTLKILALTGWADWGPVPEEDLSFTDYATWFWPLLALDGAGNAYVAGLSGSRLTLLMREGRGGGLTYTVRRGDPLAHLELGELAWHTDGRLFLSATYATRPTLSDAFASALFTFDSRDGAEALEPFEGPPESIGSPLPLDTRVLLANGDVRLLAAELAIPPVEPIAVPCGERLEQELPVRNAVPPAEWELAGGALPRGIELLPSGRLAGTPQEPGAARVRVRVRDATGKSHERPVDLVVAESSVAIRAEPNPICRGAATLLRVEAAGASVRWQPGGETTAELLVSPHETTTYTVELTDGTGCRRRGSATVYVSADDTVPPEVTIPARATVFQTTCSGGLAGATPGTSPALAHDFATAGGATDACDPGPRRLSPWLRGEDVRLDSFLPAGESTLLFRFADAAGNVGSASQVVTVLPLGDLDGSFTVDRVDLEALAASLVGDLEPGTPPFRAPERLADVDGSGRVDVLDLVLLTGYLAGRLACLVDARPPVSGTNAGEDPWTCAGLSSPSPSRPSDSPPSPGPPRPRPRRRGTSRSAAASAPTCRSRGTTTSASTSS